MLMPTRDAQEVYLRLRGWVPCAWGKCGAHKKGSVVYVFYVDKRAHRLSWAYDEANPEAAYQKEIPHWDASDRLFWKMAEAIDWYERDDAVFTSLFPAADCT